MIDVIKYLGKRWEPSFNCWDLVRLIYKQEFDISLCPHAINRSNSVRQAHREVESELYEWVEVFEPCANDVILLGKLNFGWHVGFMLTESKVLHLIDKVGTTVQSLHDIQKQFKTSTFHRHANIHSRKKPPPTSKGDSPC